MRRRDTYLTDAEMLAFRYMVEGKRDRDIAQITGLAPCTIRDQIQNAVRKLGAETRPHAVALWLKGAI